MDGQQPVGECQIMGRRHSVPAAPKPSRLWWKWSLGAQEKYHHMWEYFLEEDGVTESLFQHVVGSIRTESAQVPTWTIVD
jgi:hypothetical protein